MSEPSNAVPQSWVRRLRTVLMVLAVVMVALLLTKLPWGGGENYLVRSAYGSQLGAAPGFIAMALVDKGSGAGSEPKIYLVDTTKRVVCVYAFRNEKIRLVSARMFDNDMGILDASEAVRSEDGRSIIKPPEGNNGFDKKTAEAYAKGQQKMAEEAGKKR